MPLNFELPGLSKEEQAVWNIIREHRGKGNEVLGTVIAGILGTDYDRVRMAVGRLRRKRGKLIGSNAEGYYIPVTKDELIEYTRSMRHRALVILWTVSLQVGASMEEIFHQGRIEFDGQGKGETCNP